MIEHSVNVSQPRVPRRRWSDEVKVRIVAESFAPGAVVSEIARRHEIHRGDRRRRRQAQLSQLRAHSSLATAVSSLLTALTGSCPNSCSCARSIRARRSTASRVWSRTSCVPAGMAASLEPVSSPCSACTVLVRGSVLSSVAARCRGQRFGGCRSQGNGLRDSGTRR